MLSQATFSSSQAVSSAFLHLPHFGICHCIQLSLVSGSVHLQCDKLRNCVQVASLQLIGTNRFVDNISHHSISLTTSHILPSSEIIKHSPPFFLSVHMKNVHM